MKINFLPWHLEVISLWEKLVNENKIIQATLFAYKSQGKLACINFDAEAKKIYPYKMDGTFFGNFVSQDSEERSEESVTVILEDQILYFCKKIIEDVEMKNEINFEDSVFELRYEPLGRGAYYVPNKKLTVDTNKFPEKITYELKKIVDFFEKKMIAA